MPAITISARQEVKYAIPIIVDDDTFKAMNGEDNEARKAAWETVEQKVDLAFVPEKHFLEANDFEPSDFELMD